MRNLIQLYALTVCFFAMSCLSITTGVALWNGVRIISPEISLSDDFYTAIKSDEAFAEYLRNKNKYDIDKGFYVLPNDKALTEKRINAKVEAIETQIRSAKSNLLFCFVILFVDVVVYIFHWKLVKRYEKNT